MSTASPTEQAKLSWDNRRRHPRFDVQGSLVHVGGEPFRIAGATLPVQLADLWALVTGRRKEPREVLNLSRGGLAFRSARAVPPRRVCCQIRVPTLPEVLEITGRIRWQHERSDGDHEIGVQFDAFGDGGRMNRHALAEILMKLEQEHLGTASDSAPKPGPGPG